MLFARFQPLTHKIDKLVINDLKREMPLKYWSFRIAELLARLGIIGFICTFMTYLILGMIMQHSGQDLPQSFTEGCAKAIVSLLALFLVSFIVRSGLYEALERRILTRWHSQLQ